MMTVSTRNPMKERVSLNATCNWILVVTFVPTIVTLLCGYSLLEATLELGMSFLHQER